MLIDARTLPENKVIKSDVCIVGAGAAGITLTRELIGHHFRVSLIESGGLEYDEETQSLYKGQNSGIGYPPLDVARLRYFGGSTNHWKGFCRPLDEIDFKERPGIPSSGWPFNRSHLDSFYRRAQSYCQLGPYRYNAEDWETEQSPSLPFSRERVINRIFQLSPPSKFGHVYREEIVNADNVDTYLHSNVVDIKLTANSEYVQRMRVACLQGNKFWVTAKLFILAAGGIENPRLLLMSTERQNTGIGNQNDLVGRFFMEHVHIESGLFLPSQSVDRWSGFYLKHQVEWEENASGEIQGVLTLSEKTLLQEKLLNVSATLQPSWDTISEGVESLRNLLSAFRLGRLPENFSNDLKHLISDIDDVSKAIYKKLLKRFSPKDDRYELFSLLNRSEQSPNRNSRITLIDERDRLGKKKVQLNWQLNAIDRQSIRRTHEIIGQELGLDDLGRFRVQMSDDAPVSGGFHHMGTTRMSIDPRRGVVNENCQVHGVQNLFIAGSSVFPTCGSANPTLTIVALALRLADHIKRIVV